MAQLAGYQARVKLGDIRLSLASLPWFAVRRWEVEGEISTCDVGNMEGIPGNRITTGTALASAVAYGAILADQSRCRVLLEQATMDDTDSPFAAPYGGPFSGGLPDGIQEGDYLQCGIYPNGSTAFPNRPIYVSAFLVTKVRYHGQVGGLQPITIEGLSDGRWSFKGT